MTNLLSGCVHRVRTSETRVAGASSRHTRFNRRSHLFLDEQHLQARGRRLDAVPLAYFVRTSVNVALAVIYMRNAMPHSNPMTPETRLLTTRVDVFSAILSHVTQPIPGADELLVVPVHYWYAASFTHKLGLPLRDAP